MTISRHWAFKLMSDVVQMSRNTYWREEMQVGVFVARRPDFRERIYRDRLGDTKTPPKLHACVPNV